MPTKPSRRRVSTMRRPPIKVWRAGPSRRTSARLLVDRQALRLLRQLVKVIKRRYRGEHILLGRYLVTNRRSKVHVSWGRLLLCNYGLIEETGQVVRGVLCQQSLIKPCRMVAPSLPLVRRYRLRPQALSKLLAQVRPHP